MIHKKCTIFVTNSFMQIVRSLMISTFQSRTTFISLHRHEPKACFTPGMHINRRKVATMGDMALCTKRKKRTNKVHEYLERVNPELLNTLPKQLLTTIKKANDELYLVNPETVDEIVSIIMDDLSKNMTHVIELNPGIGLLTEKLLNAGVPFIHMFEANNILCNNLSNLTKKYPDRLKLTELNLLKITKLQYTDDLNNTTVVETALADVKPREWQEDTCMQIIGATTDGSFFRHIILSTVFKTCFMFYGRTTFYLVIDATLWIKYVSGMSHNSMAILFPILFNYKKLGTVSRESFLPWQSKKKTKSKRSYNKVLNMNEMHVIKIEPKPELFTEPLNRDNLVQFWYFIRQYNGRERKRLIPELEKLVPGCGPRLIAKDYNIFTEFTDLTPPELLDLFYEIKSWPEFDSSHFLSALNMVCDKRGMLLHWGNTFNIEDMEDSEDVGDLGNISKTIHADVSEPETCTNNNTKKFNKF